MKRYRIGITGVGGGVGQSVIKCLAQSDYDLIGLDGERHGTGLFAVPTAYRVPYAADPAYLSQLLDICKKEKIDLLFPGLDAELPVLASHVAQFASEGTRVVVSSPGVIAIADDKLATAQWLAAQGFSAPTTCMLPETDWESIAYPVLVKPRWGGARSKSVRVLHSKEAAQTARAEWQGQEDRFVVQEYITGEEFTCGTITVNGSCRGAIVTRRVLRDGDTYKSYTLRDKGLEDWLVKLVQQLQPEGACNVQLRIRDGQPYVFEFNARCSGTTAIRSMCGFNEPLMLAKYYLEQEEPVFEVIPKTIFRYWNELAIEEASLTAIETKGHHRGAFHQL